jgi:hypothetical protein
MTAPVAEAGSGPLAAPRLFDLGDPACADARTAGAKAAWLSRGITAGLPILPGLVVSAAASLRHMELGVEALASRGSGGARLEVTTKAIPEDLAAEVASRSAELGDTLVVRSSSILEGGAEWAGAFTSYLDVRPEEVARAVTGCWASAFTVATLERHEAAGIAPGSAPIAVLIQPALDPRFGGTARIEGSDVVLTAVAGSPAPLVQGWEPGVQVRVGVNGAVRGDADLMGENLVGAVADKIREADARLGANSCEWAIVDDEVTLLQLMRLRPVATRHTSPAVEALATPAAAQLARLVRRYPGPLGEALVLPWAVGDPTRVMEQPATADLSPSDAFAMAREHAAALTAEVWSLPKAAAAGVAARTLRSLRGPDPGPALATIARLRSPDPQRAGLVLAALATVRQSLVEAGAVTWPVVGWHLEVSTAAAILGGQRPPTRRQRVGFDRWEPFDAAVVVAGGRQARGAAAAPGIACGRMCPIPGPEQMGRFRPRDVVVAPYPLPHLAALLWDAAAIVTTGGGRAAHLFESARALGIPAVAAIHLDELLGGEFTEGEGRFALAVDGSAGSVFATEW